MNIKTNSKEIKEGDIFVAIKGINNDGHDFINEAISNGASKIICEHGKYDVDTLVVSDTQKYLEDYLYNNYYDMIKNINLIVITGTN